MSSVSNLMHASSLPITHPSYPRTGKRGVPQQFPRRLYEMLEEESSQTSSQHCERTIKWSKSGRAFNIADTKKFADIILPKYFKTSKFSSFQRNLNLYGFCKIRRGPDADMYAHPNFIRGSPTNLSQLRKESSLNRKKSNLISNSSTDQKLLLPTRSSNSLKNIVLSKNHDEVNIEISLPTSTHLLNNKAQPNLLHKICCSDISSKEELTYQPGSGKLSLLAFALSSLS